MPPEQTILFTVMPRGISLDSPTKPVSIFVSPRLDGANRLGDFPDWVTWVQRLQDDGLELEIRCGAAARVFSIDQRVLRPDLWEQLFNDDTYVRSHQTFEDYTTRGMISFPMRQSLSAIKSIYQQASVQLALPDRPRGMPGDQESGNRDILGRLVYGLQVHWNGKEAPAMRAAVRNMYSLDHSPLFSTGMGGSAAGTLDGEGLITGPQDQASLQSVAVPFEVFHHMPTPEYGNGIEMPDRDRLLDFHQALTSLNSYPALLRALGLVFDLELPNDFIAQTALNKTGTISVTRATAGWDWAIQPRTHPLATAYVNAALGDHELFFTASRSIINPQQPGSVVGLLNLDPEQFGLAQVDVDGAMHKAIMLAETLNPSGDHNLVKDATPSPAQHPEVFDPEATLPSLRSGGLSLFADDRALQLLQGIKQSKAFNDALKSKKVPQHPLYAEDLVRGYRLDVWDSRTGHWHSLHLRTAKYQVGDVDFGDEDGEPGEIEEGFVQLAATQSAPGAAAAEHDLYLHEAIARWSGWSLSVPTPGKHLSRYANADDAVPRDDLPDKFAENQPETPFRIAASYGIVPNSLPALRFGRRYRIRARAVDLAGNSMRFDNKLAEMLSAVFALPRDAEGFTYQRFEPVPAPLIVIRDEQALNSPGSAVDRLVIRTFNDDISKDSDAADMSFGDRHIIPPRASIEMGERLGVFDDAAGKLKGDAATWKTIADRDNGELNHVKITIAGGDPDKTFPLEPGERIDALPFFPDPLSRGAAIRDLPGTPSGAIGRAVPDAGAASQVEYDLLSDPNPRPGSATLISFGESGDWQQTRGFRFALSDPPAGQLDIRPHWDPAERLLTVCLPKGETRIVPLTSYVTIDDLKLMGVWQWLREHIEHVTVTDPRQEYLRPGSAIDQIAHVLQRAVEGGHWMLTPPHLLTLVHAVQQPIGRPEFTALSIDHKYSDDRKDPLQTAPNRGRNDPTELAAITAWRRPNSNEAYLLGALKIHGASTAKIDLRAEWNDPLDDVAKTKWQTTHRAAHVDEVPLLSLAESYLAAPGADQRPVGYYDPEHDQLAFLRWGDTPLPQNYPVADAAPRHLLGDTKRHIVSYTAIASSRFREYFDAGIDGEEFTRSSEPIVVDVPASARPLAPDIAYVVPTFGWERQTETNLKRSVRFGGGLRVYLHRPWFSSGDGELLGVALYSYQNGQLDEHSRDKFKPFFTQWGMDPIWQTGDLYGAPGVQDFPDRDDDDFDVSLEEASARDKTNQPGRVSVAGFAPQFDEGRGLWFADLTINVPGETYMPFVRLALVRYQPHALADAKVSRVVLADFVQLTPDRAAMVTADPHHPRTVRIVVSGVAPRGPKPILKAKPAPPKLKEVPTDFRLRVQQRDFTINSDLAWSDVPKEVATVSTAKKPAEPDIVLWTATVTFKDKPAAGHFRLVIEEHEYVSARYTDADEGVPEQPSRIVYAEICELDTAVISE